ncbi:MAG: HAD family hydrolase [Clostridia bacterium]|nr:HAD family hydrolase [Clostridia bacterium]
MQTQIQNRKISLENLHAKSAFICDMDGVIYHGNRLLDGVADFVKWLHENDKQFLFLTNSSERSPRELSLKLARMGLEVGEEHFYTSALATASFLATQCPGGSAYVIGEPGLVNALYEAGFSMNDYNPDYVVFGETRSMSYEKIEHAVKLVQNGAKLIGTNPDLTGPTDHGIVPACRALIAPIALTAGVEPYFVGKPNPLMMRHGLKKLNCSRRDAALIGDRMDTDIIAGIESELDTVLVLSGVSTTQTVRQFPYRPMYIMNGVGDVVKDEIDRIEV